MPVHDAGRIVFEPAQPDETLAREALARVGHLKILEVSVEAGRGILREDSGGDPVLETFRATRVDVIGVVVGAVVLAQNNADQVIGTGGQISRPHRGIDLIVRLREKPRRIACLGGIPVGLEGFYGSQKTG